MAAVACGGDPTADSTVPMTPSPGPASTTSPDDHQSSPAPARSGTPDDNQPSRAVSTDGAESRTEAAVLIHLVIVTFDVEWRPEPELSDEEVAAQRDRVRQAQAAVLDALGPDADLRREHHATAQASLKVSDDGLARLEHLAEVAAVHKDTPAPAN